MEADSPPPLSSVIRMSFIQGGAVFFCDVDADKCPPKHWDTAMGGITH
ncbi:hypothetical protein [Selenomonas sp. AE3005]|nr:hypothetical protein [Selenomonas sp. AE3005]